MSYIAIALMTYPVPRAAALEPNKPGRYRGEGLRRMKLSKRLNFRIDEETFSAFEQKVNASGMTKSEFFRDLVLNNKTQVIERKKSTYNTKHALYLLNKSSNNINQLARAANIVNQKGGIPDNIYLLILKSLEDNSNLLRAMLDHVN